MNVPFEVKRSTEIKQSTDAPTEFEPFPLPEVLDGDPRGGVHWLRTTGSGEATLMAGIFVGQPSRFRYAFETDETFRASFPRGAQATWEIIEPLRKFFVLSG